MTPRELRIISALAVFLSAALPAAAGAIAFRSQPILAATLNGEAGALPGLIVLMRGDLRTAAQAIALSRRAMRTMKQNLFWAFVYYVIGIPVAAGVLYPAFGLLLVVGLAITAFAARTHWRNDEEPVVRMAKLLVATCFSALVSVVFLGLLVLATALPVYAKLMQR